MSTDHAIEIRALTKSYGDKEVLRGLDLTVATGTVLALLGPNGAGKTTTVEILQGLRRRASGTLRVLGEDPERATRDWRARIGVVSQSATDLGDLSVREAVTHVARFHSSPADVAQTIERVGLADDARTRAARLSGGRRRRLDVALAIVGRPELLFLDEPTTGFDPEARRSFWGLVEDLRDDGTTVLLTTHYLDEAAHLADDVAIVLGGHVVERGTPAELASSVGQLRTVTWMEDGVQHSERTATPTAVVRRLTERLAGPDGEVPGIEIHAPSLEDHYLELVARHAA
ncbi:ABC transporter ATP-binding protein [Actinomyces howellii]|nr:ABC transporter ATP-binding protein [Actinomyces howellii]